MKLTFRGLRASAELTQKQLAEKAKVSMHTARMADVTPEKLTALNIIKLCEFYGVSFDDIFLPTHSA